MCVCVCLFVFKVPKLSDGQQNSENQKALPDVAGPKKQVSYKTEIIGGVPIVTQTQVNFTRECSEPHIVFDYICMYTYDNMYFIYPTFGKSFKRKCVNLFLIPKCCFYIVSVRMI